MKTFEKTQKKLPDSETAGKKTLKEIVRITEDDPSVVKVIRHFSMYMAPEEVVLQLIVAFKDDLNTKQITEAIERIQSKIRKRFPRIKQIFIEPKALRKYLLYMFSCITCDKKKPYNLLQYKFSMIRSVKFFINNFHPDFFY